MLMKTSEKTTRRLVGAVLILVLSMIGGAIAGAVTQNLGMAFLVGVAVAFAVFLGLLI